MKQKFPLPKERWEYLKSLKVVGSYTHISCKAGMIDNPLGKEFPKIPYVDRPGNTYNVGRNKEKRLTR